MRVDEDAGVGDRPPRLDDEALAARLVAWIRLRPVPPPGAPAPETQFVTGQGAETLRSSQAGSVPTLREVEHLRLVWAGVNAVEIEQLVTRTNLVIGESTGAADQEFQLPVGGIEPETLRLEVEEDERLGAVAARRRSAPRSIAMLWRPATRPPSSLMQRTAPCASATACAGASRRWAGASGPR